MAPSKSQISFYTDLVCELISSDPLGLMSSKNLRMDLSTVRSRVSSEGLSFLTKTLPRLGKVFDQALVESHFSIPREFKRSHTNGSIPAFLQAYFKCVFDPHGDLLGEVDPIAVKHLRQIFFFAYKLELPYQPEDEARVIEGFIQTERELELEVGGEVGNVIAAASYISRSIFRDFNPKDVTPRHGPGAVATGERLDDKWTFRRLYRGIHQVYPYYDYFVSGGARELIDRLDWYKTLERLDQGCAKVVLVPKDSRGPRLISCEPLEYQWIQQGLGRKLVAHLETSRFTRGQINFTDQSINQRLALESSLSGEFATIDLKDASDRVSVDLVSRVFEHTPELLRALLACRTTATRLPDGRIIPLKKYAPMGSALCFPVEAFVFWAIIVAAISRETRLPWPEVGKRVFVYGDDIVIPTEWASLSIQSLESVALRVNRSKCCITGSFRESCGTDAFKGVKVTPLRLRKQWTGRRGDGVALTSYVALANALSQARYTKAADLIWDKLEQVYGAIPYGTVFSSYPCKIVSDPSVAEEMNLQRFRARKNHRYQRIEFFVLRTFARKLKTTLDGWLRLTRDILMGSGDDPTTIVVPRSMYIKRGWGSTY